MSRLSSIGEWATPYDLEEGVDSPSWRIILKSINPATRKKYRTALEEICQAAKEASVELSFNDYKSESTFLKAEMERRVRGGQSPESLQIWRRALRKAHEARDGRSWLEQGAEITNFMKGLSRVAEEVSVEANKPTKPKRLKVPVELMNDIRAEARRCNRMQLSLGLAILFYSLCRHGHIAHILRGDVVFLVNSDDVMIYMWNFKQNSSTRDGEYVRVPGIKQELLHVCEGKAMHEPLLPDWSEVGALKFVQKYCCYRGVVGFVVDIHTLRGSGVAHMRKMGIPWSEIRMQGRWSADSKRFEVYAAELDPASQGELEKLLRTKPDVRFDPPGESKQKKKRDALVELLFKKRQLEMKAIWKTSTPLVDGHLNLDELPDVDLSPVTASGIEKVVTKEESHRPQPKPQEPQETREVLAKLCAPDRQGESKEQQSRCTTEEPTMLSTRCKLEELVRREGKKERMRTEIREVPQAPVEDENREHDDKEGDREQNARREVTEDPLLKALGIEDDRQPVVHGGKRKRDDVHPAPPPPPAVAAVAPYVKSAKCLKCGQAVTNGDACRGCKKPGHTRLCGALRYGYCEECNAAKKKKDEEKAN